MVLCTTELLDCLLLPNARITPDECGDYTPGRYGWILDNIVPLLKPVGIKGKLGLWEFEME